MLIVALFGGKLWGASWLDPVPAILCDLHVWSVGKGKYACIVSLANHGDVGPDYFKQQLRIHEELVHISVEVNHPDAAADVKPASARQSAASGPHRPA